MMGIARLGKAYAEAFFIDMVPQLASGLAGDSQA